MKFLAGLSKFISIFLMIVGTVVCTAVIISAGIIDGYVEAIWIMSGAWVCVILVCLTILATGVALSQTVKLKKQVQQLEQRLWTMSTAPASVAAPALETVPELTSVEPVVMPTDAPVKQGKKWLPAIIGASCLILAVVLVIVFVGGRNKDITAQTPAIQDTVTITPMDVIIPESEAPVEVEVSEISMGSSLSTDFVDMLFNDVVVQEDIQKSVTIGNATRTTGPEPISGQQFICLSGTIINTSTSPLPVYDYFIGRFDLGDYSYEVSANDCDILSADGSPESTIDPLMEYEFRIYTAIPNTLSEMIDAGEPCSFTFGFYDNFDNQELASNRAFAEDPIAMCPYQFFIPFQ